MTRYRIEWPNDARHEKVAELRFKTKEDALEHLRSLWTGCFDLNLFPDPVGPDHWYAAWVARGNPGPYNPRIIPQG